MATGTPSKFSVANPQDPDSFKLGQADKFIGTIGPVLAYPYVGKESKDNKHYGFVGVRITPDPESGFEEFTRSYLAFYLNSAVPSKDGVTPAGGSDEDYAALSRGKGNVSACLDESRQHDRHVTPNHENVGPWVLGNFIRGSAWDQFCTALRDSDTKGLLSKTNARVDFASGVKCRFDLVPQWPKGGPKATPEPRKEGEREQLILVPTEIISVGAAANASAGVSASAGSAPASSANGSDLASAAHAAIVQYLKENGGKAAKGVLGTKVAGILAKQGFKKADAMAWILDSNPDNPQIATNLVDIDGTSFDLATQMLELD